MELNELLDNVVDEKSFLDFVRALKGDRADEAAKEKVNPSNQYSAGVNGWANGSIESYLGAAIAWAEDSDFGEIQGLNNSCVWKKVATFLYCGKIYE